MINPNDLLNDGMQWGIEYDPNVLTPLAVRNTVLTDQFEWSWQADSQAGLLTIEGQNTGHWITGEGYLLEIDFLVDSGTAYWSSWPVQLASAALTDRMGDPVQMIEPDPAELLVKAPAYSGDVNMDGRLSLVDAILLRDITVGKTTPSRDQREMADLNGDLLLDSSDLVLMLKAIVGQALASRTTLSDLSFSRRQVSPVQVQIVRGYMGEGTVQVIVRINQLSSVAGLDLTLAYDENALEWMGVAPGSEAPSALIDAACDTPGRLRLSLASSASLQGQGSYDQGDVIVISWKDKFTWMETPVTIVSMKLSDATGQNLARSQDVFALDASLYRIKGIKLYTPNLPNLKFAWGQKVLVRWLMDTFYSGERVRLELWDETKKITEVAEYTSSETCAASLYITIPEVPPATHYWLRIVSDEYEDCYDQSDNPFEISDQSGVKAGLALGFE